MPSPTDAAAGRQEPPRFAAFDVSGQVFYETALSRSIVNLMPIVPGHVLVIPKRVSAQRLSDLTPEEVTDLFAAVQRVGAAVEKHYNAQSLTVAIQDGPLAGQSVPHVHVHIIPRRVADFDPVDEVYAHLSAADYEAGFARAKAAYRSGGDRDVKVDADSRAPPRTREDMAAEAEALAALFA